MERKPLRFAVLSAFGLALLSVCSVHSQITIWANDGADKVARQELRATKNPANIKNGVWDGKKITVFGARNEVVAFNVIIEAPTAEARDVSVSFDTLKGAGGAVINSVPVSGNGVFTWVNRNIELFYVRYLEIRGLSTDIFYDHYDERHIPERFRRPWTGDGEGAGTWKDRPDHNRCYPEIAVPMELVPSFNIAAGENQSVWMDIYIPVSSPPGLYTGTLTIRANGSTHSLPVELIVRDFALPDLPSAKTMVYCSIENINDRYLGVAYPEYGTDAYTRSLDLEDLHFQLAHRHKVSLINGWYADPSNIDDRWIRRLNGELFTASRGYTGPGAGVGNNVFSIGTYGSWSWQDGSREDMWSNTDLWVDWFDAQAFSTPTEVFLYLIDESDDFAQTEQWAKWMDENPGSGSRLMSMATVSLPSKLSEIPSLDITASWAGIGITDVWQNAADTISADPTKRLYLYNGARPGTGSFAIEDEGVSPRVTAWTQYKKKCDRWFYWEATYYDNFQGGMGQTNVFQKAQTYGSFDRVDSVLGETGWNYLNGDGVLFYPGTDTRFPSESYGVFGPFASLRLKHWRRGLQDVDYLTMAEAVNPTRTAEIVNRIIPKVVWEVGVTDPSDPTWVRTDISWSTDPDVWEAARAELADIIEGAHPLPHIKANDSDGPVTMGSNATIALQLSLAAGKDSGGNADWWLVHAPPDGNLGYFNLHSASLVPGPAPTHQGPLFSFATTEIATITGLAEGSHAFYFGVDLRMNGSVDADALFYDWVSVEVTAP